MLSLSLSHLLSISKCTKLILYDISLFPAFMLSLLGLPPAKQADLLLQCRTTLTESIARFERRVKQSLTAKSELEESEMLIATRSTVAPGIIVKMDTILLNVRKQHYELYDGCKGDLEDAKKALANVEMHFLWYVPVLWSRMSERT